MIWLTDDLPGTGGRLRAQLEDFVVEEIPAYPASGEGSHVFVTVEKRDLTTFDVVRRIAAALGINDQDIGAAGLKDRHAITRQRLSLPPPVTPEAALALAIDGVRVIDAVRHPHKLKTGHLSGNRFQLTIRDLAMPVDEAVVRARDILARLVAPPGMPNFYGEQRFSTNAENVTAGRALLRGERVRGGPRERRLYASALQSWLFNAYLEQRMKDGLYKRVITGDVLRKVATNGIFQTPDIAVDQLRLDAGEIVPTGPMYGPAMRAPDAGTEAAAREAAVLAEAGLSAEDFRRFGKLAEGTRRSLAVRVDGASADASADGTGIQLSFSLPAGTYATVLADEITKQRSLC